MAVDRIPGVGPLNSDIATATAAVVPTTGQIAAAVPTLAQITTAITSNAAPASVTMAAITSTVQTYATSRTLKRVTLTSGTSYTVPSGVTVMNVCTVGGGGGGSGAEVGVFGQSVWSTLTTSGGATISYAIGAGGAANGGAGGATSFTGATTANGANAYVTPVTQQVPTFFPNGGNAGIQGQYGVTGAGPGGSGFILIEYWS